MSFLSIFKKLFSHAPTWSQTASATLTLTAPLLQTILLTTAGEEDAAQVSKVIAEVQTDLALAAHLISDSNGQAPTADTIAAINTALDAVSDNLSDLLAAIHIKNPTTKTKVETITKTIIGETQAILALVPKK